MSWVHDTVKAGAVPSPLAPDHVLRGPRMVGVDKARRVRWDPSVEEEEDHDDRPPAKRREGYIPGVTRLACRSCDSLLG